MIRKLYKGIALASALALTMTCMPVLADSYEEKYLVLGADLSSSQKNTVLNLLDVDDESEYSVLQVTNNEEHEYLGGYLPASIIGSKALSSVTVEMADVGDGIDVSTKNITYCTADMYRNALATAGVQDADVNVAGPFDLSGTAALVGVMKAYEAMTGEAIPEESKDAATDELITTGELSESVGEEEASNLMAAVKEAVVGDSLETEEEIGVAVDAAAEQLEISLSEEDRQNIINLMTKISALDLDVEQLKQQAQGIYDKLESLNESGFFQKFGDAIQNLVNKVMSWFQ